MRRRANLLIFVVVSRALEHREGLPHVQVRPLGPAGLPAQEWLDRGPSHDRRTPHRAVYAAPRPERGWGGVAGHPGVRLDRCVPPDNVEW